MHNTTIESFGTTSSGQEALLYTLKNDRGMAIKVSSFGATLVSVLIPNAQGGTTDVVLGFDSVLGYEKTGLYLGATIGRYAGQIKNAAFELGGKAYSLFPNDHTNTLHGGQKGFDKRLFEATVYAEENKVAFRYVSPHGEEGFPGNLAVVSTYQLTEENKIIMEHIAKTDCDTVLNMTNHAYYNLNGHTSGSIENHRLTIPADLFLGLGPDCCPNGKILPVAHTPMDFRSPRPVGKAIGVQDDQLAISEGYDHNWNINHFDGSLRQCAELENDNGSVRMQMLSDLPGLQMYSGNYLNGSEPGKGGFCYNYRGALCLEPQFYPAAPNYPAFPSALLRKGETYRHTIIAQFFYGQPGER